MTVGPGALQADLRDRTAGQNDLPHDALATDAGRTWICLVLFTKYILDEDDKVDLMRTAETTTHYTVQSPLFHSHARHGHYVTEQCFERNVTAGVAAISWFCISVAVSYLNLTILICCKYFGQMLHTKSKFYVFISLGNGSDS